MITSGIYYCLEYINNTKRITQNDINYLRIQIYPYNINLTNKNGLTPLMYMTKNLMLDGSDEIINILLDVGADINKRDKYGNTALIYSMYDGFYVRKFNSVLGCVENDGKCDKVVEMLLRNGSFINVQNNEGINAIMLASRYSKKFKVENIIRHFLGSDLTLQDKEGNTAMSHAITHVSYTSSVNTVKMLVDACGDINMVDGRGRSFLITLLSKSFNDGGNELNLVKYFLSKGIDVDIQDNKGMTVLMYLAKSRNISVNMNTIVKLILDANANVNLKDNDGMTALMYLAEHCSSRTFTKMLLDKGADRLIMNNRGEVAYIISLSVKYKDKEISKLLVDEYDRVKKRQRVVG